MCVREREREREKVLIFYPLKVDVWSLGIILLELFMVRIYTNNNEIL